MNELKTRDLIALLKAKFAPPAWTFTQEVANGTGGRASRWADAVAMSVWPSRGLELHGFEIKASRADWKKELENPAKAEAVCQYMDRWWLVAGSKEIVQAGELPPTWGLLVPFGGGLKAITEAPKLEAKPITRPFLADLLRKSITQSVDREALTAEYKRGYKDGQENSSYAAKCNLEHLQQLRKVVAEFEETSGIRLDKYTWKVGRIGAAVRAVLDGFDPMESLKAIYERLGKMLREQESEKSNELV